MCSHLLNALARSYVINLQMAPSHVHLNSSKARLGPQSEPGEEEKVGRGQVIGVFMDIYTVIVLFGDNGVRRVNVSDRRCVNVCVNISSHTCAVRGGRGNPLGQCGTSIRTEPGTKLKVARPLLVRFLSS